MALISWISFKREFGTIDAGTAFASSLVLVAVAAVTEVLASSSARLSFDVAAKVRAKQWGGGIAAGWARDMCVD